MSATTVLDVAVPAVARRTYPVHIGTDLGPTLAAAATGGELAAHRPVVVTDEWCAAHLVPPLLEAFRDAGHVPAVVTMPGGESHKTRQTKADLEDRLLDLGHGRDTTVVAVGGGVVTDMAGFVAATYMRGVPYLSMPTTLLAAADAAIGGKTAVDTPHATNLVGALHHPTAVLVDVGTWRSLEVAQLREGLAETVKHACLASAELFDDLERVFVTERTPLRDAFADTGFAVRVATQNVRVKRSHVERDPGEHDTRMALNLGHTIGRAYEAASGFRVSHGQAVAVGLALQARWGEQRGYVTPDERQRVERLLTAVGLPVALPADLPVDRLLRAMHFDKKARGGTVQFVFQDGIGAIRPGPDGRVGTPVHDDEILAFLGSA